MDKVEIGDRQKENRGKKYLDWFESLIKTIKFRTVFGSIFADKKNVCANSVVEYTNATTAIPRISASMPHVISDSFRIILFQVFNFCRNFAIFLKR